MLGRVVPYASHRAALAACTSACRGNSSRVGGVGSRTCESACDRAACASICRGRLDAKRGVRNGQHVVAAAVTNCTVAVMPGSSLPRRFLTLTTAV